MEAISGLLAAFLANKSNNQDSSATQRDDIKLADLGITEPAKTTQLAALLPAELQDAAEQIIMKANPGVCFTENTRRQRDYRRKNFPGRISAMETQLADAVALAIPDDQMKTLQQEGHKRDKAIAALAGNPNPPRRIHRNKRPNSDGGSQRTRSSKRSLSNRADDNSDRDGESIGSKDSKRSGRVFEYARNDEYDSFEEEEESEEVVPQPVAAFRPTHIHSGKRIGEASHPGPSPSAPKHYFWYLGDEEVEQGPILWLLQNACDLSFNDLVIKYVREKAMKDPRYKKSKSLHKTKQAGVFHLGAPFHYNNENFEAAEIPQLFNELTEIAENLTSVTYNIILFKVYQPGESLAKHQDVDGSDMSVACFTFASDPSQRCKVVWHRGKHSNVEKFHFTPRICSMWYMGGTTNSQYSHRVLAAETPLSDVVTPLSAAETPLRVSVSFRRSAHHHGGMRIGEASNPGPDLNIQHAEEDEPCWCSTEGCSENGTGDLADSGLLCDCECHDHG